MTHTPVPHKTLIVVGTGEGAKFYRNSGKSGELKLQHEHDLKPGDLADQGPAGKQPPDVSAKESMEATFAKILANHLYDLAQAHKFDKLILVLDPETLVNNTTDQIERSILSAL